MYANHGYIADYMQTHPVAMDSASSLKQHDNLHRQIAAFEKLLQHAINKFSKEKLYGMLKILTRDFSREYTPGDHIYSMSHLKKMVQEQESEQAKQPISKDTEKHVMKYFKTFFEDVEYLSELKKYFDEKIYICLYEYFYDPLDDIQEVELETLLTRKDDGVKEELDKADSSDDQSDGGSRKVKFDDDVTEVYTGDRKEEEIVFDFLSSKGKLSHAVRQMFKVNQKWDNILNQSDPHMECYDPDSKYELVVFTDYVKYEPVLRLVPDIFVKAYKSIELAKLWWTHANKVYVNKPMKRRTIKDFVRQESKLEQKIIRVTEDIHRFEDALVSREKDLESLKKRETRFEELSDQCEKLEERKDYVAQTYNTILKSIGSMKQELAVLEKGTKRYSEIEHRLKETDRKLMLTQDELKILAYHFHIVQEDFNLELELRPHLIRFKADIEVKMGEVLQDIEGKKTEKRKTEKTLVLLKTNCDRMKQIMQKLNLNEGEDGAERELSEADVNHNNVTVSVKEKESKGKEGKTSKMKDKVGQDKSKSKMAVYPTAAADRASKRKGVATHK